MRAPRRPSSLLVPAVVLAGLVASLVTVLGAAPAGAAVTDLRINEVESNGGTPVDWIELVNTGTQAVDASGLRLKDDNDTRTLAIPAGTTIAPGGFYAIDVDVTGGFGLGAADTARLFQSDGTTLIDSYAWTAHASTTYGRCPDGTGAFVTTVSSTKGAANACAATPADLRINEVESNGDTRDWVELYNRTTAPIAAGGLVLKDNDDTHAVTIAAGTTVPAGGFVAIDVDDPAVTGQFGLGTSDAARLFLADGTTLVDSHTWTAHASTTYGRCPDGTGSFVTTGASTKGAANNCSAPPSTGGGIVFNEVESNGDTVGDFAEVVNTSSAAIDISDWKFTDSEPERVGHVYSVPAGTVVQPGAYYVLAEAAFGFGLGAPDGVRLLRADGTTVVDTYSWTAHAATTYGRCPDRTGPIVTTTSSTRGAANDCSSPVRINEVESDGGTPGDWVELVNNGTTAADVGGFVLRDSNDTPSYTIPTGTTIAAGGYLVLENPTQFSFGLGSADSARLFATGGTTLVDSYSWTAHAATTYGRCANGTGAFATTQASTKGAANSCPGEIVAGPWPGGQDVVTADPQNTFQSNLSGLVYEPSGLSTPGAMWAVKNGPGTLYRLTPDGSGYAPQGEWAAGKLLHYTDGTGDVDAEGVTVTSDGAAGGLYVASERNNANNAVSRPAILRFDPTSGRTDLTAQRDWNLTADLPGLGANLGLEAIAWVPDSYLTARGFVDQNTGTAYRPSAYAGHGDGLFLVGVEQTGRVYAYALDQASDRYTRVASFASGFVSVMELYFEPETQQLWVVCDDGCQGRSARFDVGASGAFAPTAYYERPTGMPNLNNEGFTLAPRAECVAGRKPAFWADDSSTGGYALRRGTVSCTPRTAQSVSFTSTPPASPVVGQTYVVAAVGGPSGRPVRFSTSTPSICSVSGTTVRLDHVGTCTVRADQDGDADREPGAVTQQVVVGKGPQTVTFTSNPPTSPVVGQSYTVAATGGPSGNPVTFAESSEACTLAGATVTVVAPGPCVVVASQAGGPDHLAATASQSRTAVKASTAVAVTVTPGSVRAVVAVVAPGAAPVSGDVTFLVDGEFAGTAPVSDGTATLPTVVPAGGPRTVYAAYAGSPLLHAATGSVLRRDPLVTVELTSPVPRTAGGWWTAPVTATFTCTPQGSPVLSCPEPVLLDESGTQVSVTRSATAEDGGVGSASADGIRIDLDAPTVRVAGVRDGAGYLLDAPSPECVATDAVSGVASCTLTSRTSGQTTTVTATATDAAGNESTTSVTWRRPTLRVSGALAVTSDGRYVVERGTTYRVVALLPGSPAPRAHGPLATGTRPSGTGLAMTRGTVSGDLTTWTRAVVVTGTARDQKVVVRSGGRDVVVRLSVR